MIKHPQDFFLNCKDCVLENPRSFYGCFSLGPFQNSQSLTVANALRRTLLSELRGIAITHVEINGVVHEYSTLPGLRESILDMLLNFKQIVLKKVSPFSKPLYGYLNVRGPGIIRASDFKLPPLVQCVDPDQYIATLNENGQLTLKFQIADYQTFLKNSEIVENFSFQAGVSTETPELSKQASFGAVGTQKNNGISEYGPVQPFFKTTFQLNEVQSKKTFWQEKSEFANGKLNSIMPNLSIVHSSGKKNENDHNVESLNLFPKSSLEKKKNRQNKGKLFEHISSSNGFLSQATQEKKKNNHSVFDLNRVEQNTAQSANDFFFQNSPLSQLSSYDSLTSKSTVQTDLPPNVSNSKSLWVDPIFNPILKVNYVIENLEPSAPRQKEKPNQVVMIELWTNGSIHPRKAFYDALFYLKTMFEKLDAMKFLNSQFTNSLLESEKTNTKFLQSFEHNIAFYTLLEKKNSLNVQNPHNQQRQAVLSLPIERLQLPSRIIRSLRQNHFQTIGDLLQINLQNLKTYPGIGNFSIVKIQKSLQQLGIE